MHGQLKVKCVYVVFFFFFFKFCDKSQHILFDFLTCSMNCLFIAVTLLSVFTFEDHKLISSLIYPNYVCVIYCTTTASVSTSHCRSVQQ